MEQKPLLVMEYLPLGNLSFQNRKSRITEEESIGILCQGLQALEHLHSQSIVHRDIKPENILIKSRRPFLLKLVDFGFARNGSVLKTFCGTDPYAAPEIWKHNNYTSAVDVWSLAVVVLEYGYGLPKPTRERKGIRWCQDICQAADDSEGEGDALIDFLSTDMLRMEHQDRLSTSDCLKRADHLGFLNIEIMEAECLTPKGFIVPQ